MYEKKQVKSFYESMVKIRRFEECVERYFLDGEIPGFMHLYIGEEAIATGVCQNLTSQDYIASTHRGHGHTIAKGADLNGMMAELFGRKTGLCKGKGGSMHVADFRVGMLGANGVVGGGYALAVGAALAEKMKGTRNVAAVFFGDGASNRGTFHESLNMAAVWKLPVLFVCENNGIAATTPYEAVCSAGHIADRAAGYQVPGVMVDGNDVFAVYEAAGHLIEAARNGEGPAILECRTFRQRGHFVGDPQNYRDKGSIAEHMKKDDPIGNLEVRALEEGLLSEAELKEIQDDVKKSLEEAVRFAKDSPYPEQEELYTHVL